MSALPLQTQRRWTRLRRKRKNESSILTVEQNISHSIKRSRPACVHNDSTASFTSTVNHTFIPSCKHSRGPRFDSNHAQKVSLCSLLTQHSRVSKTVKPSRTTANVSFFNVKRRPDPLRASRVSLRNISTRDKHGSLFPVRQVIRKRVQIAPKAKLLFPASMNNCMKEMARRLRVCGFGSAAV